MKRSVQEIIELVVFGLIALLIGTGLLWVTGWLLGLVGLLFKFVAGLIWSLLRFIVPLAIIAAIVYALVRVAQGRSARSQAGASPPTASTGPSAATATPTAATTGAATGTPTSTGTAAIPTPPPPAEGPATAAGSGGYGNGPTAADAATEANTDAEAGTEAGTEAGAEALGPDGDAADAVAEAQPDDDREDRQTPS